MYQKYYKLGLDHFFFKKVLGQKNHPSKFTLFISPLLLNCIVRITLILSFFYVYLLIYH